MIFLEFEGPDGSVFIRPDMVSSIIPRVSTPPSCTAYAVGGPERGVTVLAEAKSVAQTLLGQIEAHNKAQHLAALRAQGIVGPGGGPPRMPTH